MIVHLDADAFFASVEQAADPKLRGRPVAVGGERRGIIASASYEARKLGIYTPMPTARARKLCPRLIIVPGDYEKYERFSRFMFSYAFDFTPLVEITSIDEGYFDLTGNRKKSAREVAETIRTAVRQSLKISVSEGIGANKLVSQIASKLHKPANLLEVPRGHEKPFLWPLPNHWLPGVGPKASSVLNSAGLAQIEQIAHTPVDMLSMLVGSYAPQLREFANGIDQRPVTTEQPEAKSYGEQQTFGTDITDESFLLATLRSMADRLMAKVRADKKSVRTLTLRLRYNDMDEVTRRVSLMEPTDLETDVYCCFPSLLKRAWERRVSVRLIGLRFSHVYDALALPLALDQESRQRISKQQLSGVIDGLRRELGSHAVMRGHDLWLKGRANQPRDDLSRRPAVSISLPRRAVVQRQLVYAALNIKSHYSFCDSLLSVPAIIEKAQELGITALAITDPNLHGAVEFFVTAKEAGIKPIIAAEVGCGDTRANLYVRDRHGYQNLCRILSQGTLTEPFLGDHLDGLIRVDATACTSIALPEIRYHRAADRLKYDILQSIRTLTRLHESHADKRRGDFHFPAPAEVSTLFDESAIAATLRLAEQCDFEFETNRLRFPNFAPPDGSTPQAFLRRLALEGLSRRYGLRASGYRPQLEQELSIIAEVGYAEYFLVVWDILQECQRRGIDWITRGSAADSMVCYCLGISGVCPARFDLYFQRFLNKDRMALNKLPDIDIDFPHDRKDDVIDLIFERYGSEHAAVVGGFSTFQGRSAVADIAKVLGVSEYQIRRFTERIPWSSAADVKAAIAFSAEARENSWEENPYKTAVELAAMLDGFPRYPKMHPCGVVLSRDPIAALTPLFRSSKGYLTTHFDMESVESVGLVKMDILAQGGLAVMRDALRLIRELGGLSIDLAAFEPWEDAKVWDMIANGESRGVHHIESPAMLSLARMSNVRDIDRLVAIVSVIRPGAANGAKKMQFARRAQGIEPVDYPHPSLIPVLRWTFGLIAYEEHVLQICEAFAGLNAGRADILRRALAKRNTAKIEEIKPEFAAAARALLRTDEEIARVWEMLLSFQGYAFCRAHSTAYGVEAYQGAYLKRNYPVEFLSAVLSNGKGFYSTLAYTLECRRLGIGFLSPDVNASRWNFQPETTASGSAICVPLRMIKEISTATLERYRHEHERAPFASLTDFFERVTPTVAETQNLIRAGAFDSFGEPRTAQFWQLQHLAQWPRAQAHLFHNEEKSPLPAVQLTEPDYAQRLRDEMELLGFTVSGHPLDQYRDVAWSTYCPITDLGKYAGEIVTICGLVIEHRLFSQSTGETMKFITVCDYSGILECEIFAAAYRAYGINTVRYPVVELTGRVTRFENAPGYLLEVQRISKPRKASATRASAVA